MSVLGADLTLLGDKITIISQSKLQVDAKMRGDIHAKEVVINAEGSVSGEVWAERIDVRGEVRGTIIAVTVALHESPGSPATSCIKNCRFPKALSSWAACILSGIRVN